jgi:hypothetical protein
MTLDEAIIHCDEKINQMCCGECKQDHIELLDFLIELREYRIKDINNGENRKNI